MCEGYPPGYGCVQEWKVGGILIKRGGFGPLLCGGAGAVAAATLHLLYYFIYLLVIPGECRQGWGLTG